VVVGGSTRQEEAAELCQRVIVRITKPFRKRLGEKTSFFLFSFFKKRY
jgi:hypothetical protein